MTETSAPAWSGAGLVNGNLSQSLLDADRHKPTLLWHVSNRENYNPLALYRPYDVAFLWDNRAVVVEGFWPYSRIQVLDQDGKRAKSIGQGEILPFGITIDSEGYMAITDHRERTVKFFTPNGDIQLSWSPEMFEWPDGIANTGTGHYVVTDFSKGTASIHDIDGVRLREFSTRDVRENFSCPAYVEVDNHQRVIVTDTADHTVKIFDMTGKQVVKFGLNCPHSSPVPMKDPHGICLNKAGNILVAESGNNCISCYSPDGRFIEYLLTSSDGDIKYPWGLAMNHSGQLLVSEQKINSNPGLKLYQCPE